MKHLLISLFVCASLFAQQPPPQQPPAVKKPSPTRPVPTKEDFVKAAREIDTGNAARKAKTEKPDFETSIVSGRSLPGDRQIVLPESALQAIRLSSPAENEAVPFGTSNGRVGYIYGRGIPNVPCEIGYTTRIELQPGEKFDERIPYGVGENEPWNIQTATMLMDGVFRSFAVITPKRGGSRTNLSLFTDRRAYDIILLSHNYPGIGHVNTVVFSYPEWDAKQRETADVKKVKDDEQQVAEKKEHAQAIQQRKEELKASDTLISNVHNADYSSKAGRGGQYLLPEAVWDDGTHTFIKIHAASTAHGLPALKVRAAPGIVDIPNFHFTPEERTYTVDGIFQSADLVVAEGKKSYKVTIQHVARK